MVKKSATKAKPLEFLKGYSFLNIVTILSPLIILTVLSALVSLIQPEIGNLIAFVGLLSPFVAFYWLKRTKNLTWKDFGIRKTPIISSAKYIFLGLIIFWVINIIIQMFAPLAPELSERQDLFGDTSINFAPWVLLIAVGIFGPILEELAYRGILFGFLGRRMGIISGAVVSSLVFGLVHGQLNVSIAAFFFGLYFCYISVKFQSLIPAILLHILNNSLGVSLIILTQSLTV